MDSMENNMSDDAKPRSRSVSAAIKFGSLVAILLFPTLALATFGRPVITLESFLLPFKDGDSWTYEVSDKLGARLLTKGAIQTDVA